MSHINVFNNPYYIAFPTNHQILPHRIDSELYISELGNKILNFPISKNIFMDHYSLNEHHIKPSYYWTTLIPQFFDFIGISYDTSLFERISYFSEDNVYDLSYHVPSMEHRANYRFQCRSGEIIHGDDTILRGVDSNCTNPNANTNYHRLFRGSHDVGVIINDTIKTGEHILLHCDSMSIPIIPILARFVKSITFIDNRWRPWFMQLSEYQPYTKCIIARISANMNPRRIVKSFK